MALEQEGYRWRNDDGSETSATWMAAQDTNVSLPLNSPKRLRVIVNVSTNPAPATSKYRLEYKEAAEAVWTEVKVGGGGKITMAASSNITASGEATTFQLTAPSGKTTSDFVAGRMWDDESGLDDVAIADSKYTELEFCVQAVSANGATVAEVYSLRVVILVGVGSVITFNKVVTNSTPNSFYDINPAATIHDVLIAFGVTDASADTWTWPASFDELSNQHTTVDNMTLGTARKKDSTGAEGVITTTTVSSGMIGGIASFTGVNNTTPEDVTPVAVTDNTSTASPWTVDGSLTTITNGCMIVAIVGSDNLTSGDVVHSIATIAGTTGAWTKQADITTGSFSNAAIFTCTQAVAGAITVRATGTLSGNAGKAMILIPLRPA